VRGEFVEAAQAFRDPMWQGAACYRAGEFEKAAQAFARRDTAEAHYNQGNAWLMDLPVFVDVSSIVSGYSMETSVNVAGQLSSAPGTDPRFREVVVEFRGTGEGAFDCEDGEIKLGDEVLDDAVFGLGKRPIKVSVFSEGDDLGIGEHGFQTLGIVEGRLGLHGIQADRVLSKSCLDFQLLFGGRLEWPREEQPQAHEVIETRPAKHRDN